LRVTYLVNGTRGLLSHLAAARALDLGEVLSSGEKMSGGDFTLGVENRTEWLVDFGQLFSMRL